MRKKINERATAMELRKGGKHDFIRKLILEGFFDSPVTTAAVVTRIRERFGKRLKPNHVQTYMQKFMAGDMIHGVKVTGVQGNYWVVASVPKKKALLLINKANHGLIDENDIFSDKLVKKLSKNFATEFDDLKHNFGRSGTCTAFLLRKILEKLIYISFAKHRVETKLEDRSKAGGLVGLETMINIASSEKVRGIPFLTPKTAKEIKGVKFLGDSAAHNPLINVDMKTITPQLPFIITAYEELAKKL